jgi:pimeloyl-ACP methyl ester carboxylesterase
MVELHKGQQHDKAIWIGHDWGSLVVWNLGLHHSKLVKGLGSLCVPFGWGGHPDTYLSHIDRELYPENEYPYGQWDYMYYYYENFALACKQMEEDPHKMIKLNFTKPSDEFKGCFNAGIGAKSMTASIRNNGGWFKHANFNGLNSIPDVPVDSDLISESEAQIYGNFLEKNGFFGPNSWYVNGEKNDQYAKELNQFTTIDCPVLFIQATYDSVLTSNFNTHNKMVCTNLTEKEVKSGHWMAREKPIETNKIIKDWIEVIK